MIIKDRDYQNQKEEFVPEAGLARNRMKQYLEAQEQAQGADHRNDTGEVIGKGYAKNLLNKWKSMETVEGGRRLSKEGSPGSMDHIGIQDGLVEEGHARNLRTKWQNQANGEGETARRKVRQITPPPGEEIHRIDKSIFENGQLEGHAVHKTVDVDSELGLIGRVSAKNRLAK